MDELKKLKARLRKQLQALETARLAFDLEMRDYLVEEIQELQQQIDAIEKGKA